MLAAMEDLSVITFPYCSLVIRLRPNRCRLNVSTQAKKMYQFNIIHCVTVKSLSLFDIFIFAEGNKIRDISVYILDMLCPPTFQVQVLRIFKYFLLFLWKITIWWALDQSSVLFRLLIASWCPLLWPRTCIYKYVISTYHFVRTILAQLRHANVRITHSAHIPLVPINGQSRSLGFW